MLKISNYQQGELTTGDQELLIRIHYFQAIVLPEICLQDDNFRHRIHSGSQQNGPTLSFPFKNVLILCSLLSLVHSFISSLTVLYAKEVFFTFILINHVKTVKYKILFCFLETPKANIN